MFMRLWRDISGASVIEYSILVAIITTLVVGGVAAAGSWVHHMWAHLLSSLSG
jgi:Flp pilus assembly pilin Flp